MRKYGAGGAKKKKAMSGTKVVKKAGYGGKAASMVPSKAKKGGKVPKGFHRMPNGKLMKNSDMKKAGHGMMKKAKTGLKQAPAGSKGKGMRALPKAVRNKIGFAKKGKKVVKKAGYGKSMKAKSGMKKGKC